MARDKTVLFIIIAILAVLLFLVFAIMVSNGVGIITSTMIIILPLITLGVILVIFYKSDEEEQKIDVRDRYSSNTSN